MKMTKVIPQPEQISGNRYKIRVIQGRGFVGDAIFFNYPQERSSPLFIYACPAHIATEELMLVDGTFYWIYD